MIVELDRICDLIEWRIEPNRIIGRVRLRDVHSERSVAIRLKGYSVHDRMRKRSDAQISIALEIIKDVYHGRLSDTKQLANGEDTDDESGKKRKPSRGRPPKDARKAQSADGE